MANTKSIADLVRLLKDSNPHHPRLVLFLGAGASVSSGISSGWDLVCEWREAYDAQHTDEASKASKQDWYDQAQEYGALFEKFYATEALRREFIEQRIGDASPSWGYVYLADLILKGYFTTILTTNFDDLVNEACLFLTPSLKPLVCSHDANLNQFRLTSPRPKIIKLHGDYLFEDIKNTNLELLRLGPNAKEKIVRLAEDAGLVVVGYSGNDNSVMAPIAEALNSGKYPHGVYWCCQNPSKLSPPVRALLAHPKFYVVKIDTFDRLMADMHDKVVGDSPTTVTSPHGAMTERLTKLVEGLSRLREAGGETHPVIERDYLKLADSLKPKDEDKAAGENNFSIELPAEMAGALSYSRGEFKNAQHFLLLCLNPRPTVRAVLLLFESLRHHWDAAVYERAISFLEGGAKIRQAQPPSWMMNLWISLMHANQYDAALRICGLLDTAFELYPDMESKWRDYNFINRMQVSLHKGELLSPENEAQIRHLFENTDSPGVKFGCQILLGNHREAVEIVRMDQAPFSASCMDWPIVRLMPAAEKTRLRGIVGDGGGHLGNLNFDFKIGTPGRE